MSLQLTNLEKAFGSKRILKGLTLDVQDGETAAIALGDRKLLARRPTSRPSREPWTVWAAFRMSSELLR